MFEVLFLVDDKNFMLVESSYIKFGFMLRGQRITEKLYKMIKNYDLLFFSSFSS